MRSSMPIGPPPGRAARCCRPRTLARGGRERVGRTRIGHRSRDRRGSRRPHLARSEQHRHPDPLQPPRGVGEPPGWWFSSNDPGVRTSIDHRPVRAAMSNIRRRVRFVRDHRWAPGRMSPYIEGELPGRARRRVERHVGECDECLGILTGLERMLGKLHGLAPPTPSPDSRELAAQVRHRLSQDSER